MKREVEEGSKKMQAWGGWGGQGACVPLDTGGACTEGSFESFGFLLHWSTVICHKKSCRRMGTKSSFWIMHQVIHGVCVTLKNVKPGVVWALQVGWWEGWCRICHRRFGRYKRQIWDLRVLTVAG